MRHLGARVVTALASAALVGTMVGAPASSATAASATTSASTTRLASSDTRPSPAYPCRGYGLLDRQNPVGDLDRDLFTWGPYKKTRVGNGRHDINWALDPHKQDSWKTLFHSLNWTGAYIYRSTQGMTAQRDPKAIDNAVAIAQDWVRDNRYPWPTGPGAGNATHTRADFLMCLRDGLQQVGKPVPRWLDTSLVQHATWLRANTWPDHNVGTEQTLSVMGIGCTLRRNDLRTYAVDKLGRDITRVIDAQGANNEQAVGYARYNHALWGYVENALTACNVDTRASRTITSRRDALQGFLDHAVKPDGTFHQLGDTQVEKPQAHAMSPAQEWALTQGKSGTPPRERVKIYDAGYVFGRSGWGTGKRAQSQESSYAVRFGPQRTGHGHNDHMAITWNTLGRPILVDTGTGSYNQGPWRQFYLSAQAHNQLVLGGMPPSQPATRLTRRSVKTGADFYQLTDSPAKGASRVRSLIVLSDPDIVLVVDKAASKTATTFTQYWHLPPDVAHRASGTSVVATRSGVATTLLQLPVGAQKPSSFGVVKGSTKPLQGWRWSDYHTRRAAPTATVTRKGTRAEIATAVVAAPQQHSVRASTSTKGAVTTYTFTVGPQRAVVTLDAAGVLTRVR